ncbi:winged helix-turn-helix transcriptional regulator [Streptomyces sp. NPDC049687]|uniref:winged helix-turn-helix transcriptional regulator n=1 Tax=Streptomyces sp. NPDC049687 TaxID=3365596 RepID=UPI0037BBF1FC
MVTEEVGRVSGDADVTRAHSLAREIFSGIANKWTLLVVSTLGERTLRFTQLRVEVEGVSHKMLTQTLRGLERDGLVERTVYPTVPHRLAGQRRRPGPLRQTDHRNQAGVRHQVQPIEHGGGRRNSIGGLHLADALPI